MSASTAWVSFLWKGQPVVLEANEVTAVVDTPVYAPLPVEVARIRLVMAYGGELCPVYEPVNAPEAPSPEESALVLLDPGGNVAVRVRSAIRIQAGEREGADLVRLADERGKAERWTRSALLSELGGASG